MCVLATNTWYVKSVADLSMQDDFSLLCTEVNDDWICTCKCTIIIKINHGWPEYDHFTVAISLSRNKCHDLRCTSGSESNGTGTSHEHEPVVPLKQHPWPFLGSDLQNSRRRHADYYHVCPGPQTWKGDWKVLHVSMAYVNLPLLCAACYILMK